MKAYSQDLRERIIADIENGGLSQVEACEQYAVSLSFIEKLLHRWRTTQELSPRTGRPGRKRVLEPYSGWLRATVKAQPDLTLDEIAARFTQEQSRPVNPSMVRRELLRLALRLKKSRSTPASATRRASKRSALSSTRSSRLTWSRA